MIRARSSWSAIGGCGIGFASNSGGPILIGLAATASWIALKLKASYLKKEYRT